MSHAAYIGIIGAAHARAADSALHRAGVFEAMCAAVERVIVEDWQLQWDTVVLVSGGAAWGDHVAVALFMERACDSATDRRGAPKLRLLLPCKWDAAKKQFEDNGQVDWRINPGGTANTYHRQCSASTGRDTLADLEKAQKLGAAWQDDFFGFHHRNLVLARTVTHCIALTDEADEPTEGGTGYTWARLPPTVVRVHLSLQSLATAPHRKRALAADAAAASDDDAAAQLVDRPAQAHRSD